MRNLYKGEKIKLIRIQKQTKDTKLYAFRLEKNFYFTPGQFIMLSVPGVGEAPFAPCSNPEPKPQFQLSIRKVGLVTKFLDQMENNKNQLEFRGPYGNGFPITKLKNKNLVLIAGGTGIAPIASLIEYLISRRKNFGKIHLLYGVKKAEDLLFGDKLKKWQKKINVMLCAEEIDKNWEGETGMVTDLCCDVRTDPAKTLAIMCGPSIMYKPLVKELGKLTPRGSPSEKIKPEQIYVSMEARMKCGLGKCQHCTIGKHYTCLDGPVFQYSEIVSSL